MVPLCSRKEESSDYLHTRCLLPVLLLPAVMVRNKSHLEENNVRCRGGHQHRLHKLKSKALVPKLQVCSKTCGIATFLLGRLNVRIVAIIPIPHSIQVRGKAKLVLYKGIIALHILS